MITNFSMDYLSILLGEKKASLRLIDDIIIYGAGNFGKEICGFLLNNGHRVIAFLDRKAAQGDQWNDIPIYQPNWSGLTAKQKSCVTVLVAIHNRTVHLLPIFELLKDQGYSQILNPAEFFDCFAPQLGDRFWLTSLDNYQDWKEEILQGYAVWEDEISRSIYLSLLNQRLQGDYSALSEPDFTHQYFPLDIPAWEKPLRFIDCGAYDGDTLRSMKNNNFSFDFTVAFEPDVQNFKRLTEFVLMEWQSPVLLYPCGIYSSTKLLQFSAGSGESGKVINSSNNFIQGIALDDVIYGFKPNLIKMDIEGSEIEGLMGAMKIIENDLPGLAICVYHKPQHLWQIPLMIYNWNLGYKFYLRSHAYNGFEAVMYALTT